MFDYQGTDKNESPILMTSLFGLTLMFMTIELSCYVAVYSYLGLVL